MAEALESTKLFPEKIPEEEPEPTKKPPLRLVPRPEKKESEEIYANYSTAKAEGLFQPGTVFEVLLRYNYPVLIVLSFDPDKDQLTVKRHDKNTGMFNKKPETLIHDELIQCHHFRKLYKIDIQKENWEAEPYQTNIPDRTS